MTAAQRNAILNHPTTLGNVLSTLMKLEVFHPHDIDDRAVIDYILANHQPTTLQLPLNLAA